MYKYASAVPRSGIQPGQIEGAIDVISCDNAHHRTTEEPESSDAL